MSVYLEKGTTGNVNPPRGQTILGVNSGITQNTQILVIQPEVLAAYYNAQLLADYTSGVLTLLEYNTIITNQNATRQLWEINPSYTQEKQPLIDLIDNNNFPITTAGKTSPQLVSDINTYGYQVVLIPPVTAIIPATTPYVNGTYQNFTAEATNTAIEFLASDGSAEQVQHINTIEAILNDDGIRIQLVGGGTVVVNKVKLDECYISGALVTQVLATAVIELNTLFVNAGGAIGLLPVITSSASILLTAGNNINHTVTGTNIVSVDFDISTTGTVPVGNITQVDFERRKIIGGSSLAAGVYTVITTVYNYFGQVSQTITITVSSAFTNTYSLYSNASNLTSRLIANFDNSPTYRLNDATATAWTVVCWFKNIYTWATADICRHNYNFYGGALYIGSTSTTITMTYGDTTDYLSATANSGGVADLDWHMVAVTYDGTTTDAGASSYGAFKFYFDSVLIASPTWTAGGTGWSGAISGAVNYKGFQIATVKYGYRDELGTYPKALNQTDITAIYNSGTPIDLNTFSPTTAGATLPLNYYRFGDGNSGATTDITGYPTMYNMGSLGSGADMTNGGGTVADIVSSVP